MSSVQSYIKQQNIVYGAIPHKNAQQVDVVTLNSFTRNPFVPSDPNSTSGHFAQVDVNVGNDASGFTPIFRDMGQVIRSAGRTFRRVQQISNAPVSFGVDGSASTNSVVSDYRTYWYEVSLVESGNSVVNALFQIRG